MLPHTASNHVRYTHSCGNRHFNNLLQKFLRPFSLWRKATPMPPGGPFQKVTL